MKRSIVVVLLLIASGLSQELFSQSKKRSFFEIRVYHFQTSDQESAIDDYLKNAYLPALNNEGIRNIGVFKPISNDTARNKRIIMLIPFKNANKFTEVLEELDNSMKAKGAGQRYWHASHDKAPYKRIESTLVKAFASMPNLAVPLLKNEAAKRVYELRSYEGPTEMFYNKKVHMFDVAGETNLFKKLGFNPVFFGTVLAGSRKPNLMYMTSFEDMAARDAHWKTFVDDPEWKKMSSNPYYNHTVSHQDIVLLHPTSYSGI